jgi:phosphoglucomutase
VFAPNGDEENASPDITPADAALVATATECFLGLLAAEAGDAPTVAVGVDSRHSGPAIAHVAIRSLLAGGAHVRYLFITAAPEIMAYTRTSGDVDGFVYISASHNPVGHNGIKFGFQDGGVLPGETAGRLIADFTEAAGSEEVVARTIQRVNAVPADDVQRVFERAPESKQEALSQYSRFLRQVVVGSIDEAEQSRFYDSLATQIRDNPLGVVAELNGSARTVSVDIGVLKSVDLRLRAVNDRPRGIAHRIVPEGASLDQCRHELERAYAEDSAFMFGYVPDNDGDRGNLVYVDRKTGSARPLLAQEVFGLSCLAELSFLVYSGAVTYSPEGRPDRKLAVAVNGPTSLRVDRIAQVFGAEVFRAEVGEANVVNLADKLREEGYLVRILGEGSNGGNITFPSRVRDPLSTVFALLKLLRMPDAAEMPSPLSLWRSRLGMPELEAATVDVERILESMPRFTTTSAFESRAALRIRRPHRELKARYEAVFLREWETRKDELRRRLGIVSWQEVNYERTTARVGFGLNYRTGDERGGLKMELLDEGGKPIGFLWMRGSGTEPVFRILADIEGDAPEAEAELLDWQTAMVTEADGEDSV